MSFLALDMRTPEKCVKVEYPEDTTLDIHYEVLDPKKDKLHLGVKMDNPLSQTKIQFSINPTRDSDMKPGGRNSMVQEVKDIQGKLRYQGEGEGELNICVRIAEVPGKKYMKPALVAFRVAETGGFDEPQDLPVDKKGQEAAKTHLSDMERILNKMIKDASLLLKSADMIKNDESAFHKQSVEMNAAARWWPMLHVVVLLVTGFTQANHVVKFFKSRHIIY